MIDYNPKDWFTFIFKFHKSDTVRKLMPLMIAIAAYCVLIVYVEKEYLRLTEQSYLKNIPLMHALLGGAISLLLVFRTNSAYDRWWEGRKHWGDLTNQSRNLLLKLNSILPKHDIENRIYFKKIVPLYALALRKHLLKNDIDDGLFENNLFAGIEKEIATSNHLPNSIASILYYKIDILCKEGKITELQLIYLNEELRAFTNICGACERIKNTPIPYSYSVFIKKFIFGYIMTLPFGYVFSLGYLSVPIIIFIFYVLASLELIAEEIEDPFGNDTNDLPMKEMSLNIAKNAEDIVKV